MKDELPKSRYKIDAELKLIQPSQDILKCLAVLCKLISFKLYNKTKIR